MGHMPATLQEAIQYFSDVENCQQFMIDNRWDDGKVRCPYCGSKDVTYLGSVRRWKCYGKHPKAQFSLKVGTIFEDSPIPLEKWLPAMWLIANCKNGISSYELAADLGVSQRTAWFMLHRLRAIQQAKSFRRFSGEVEADETYIGGKVKNMHRLKKIRKYLAGDIARGGTVGKALVMGLLERNTKQVRATVLPELRKTHTDEQVRENVEPGSKLYTDEANHYDYMPEYAREFINHREAYVRGAVHTNTWKISGHY